MKVNAGYQTPKSYKLVNLKLSSIVIEKERINLCFEEGTDEIGKKLLIQVINGIFQKQKN